MASKKTSSPIGPHEPLAGQMLIYRDAGLNLQVRLDSQTVWLTQLQMADLFQTTKQNISLHIQNIFAEGELEAGATVKQYLTVQKEGSRQVQRQVEHYGETGGAGLSYLIMPELRRSAVNVLWDRLQRGRN